MNKTYKVIYNRTRCMYQVVSELAKGHTKSETPEMLKSLFSKHSGLTRGIVMAVLSMSLAMPVGVAVQAADTTVTVKDGVALVGSGAVSVSSSTDNNTITIAVPTDGKVEANNTGLVNGGTVYTAITDANTALSNKIGTLDANGNYIQKDASVSSNLSTLDTQVKINAGAISKEKTDREAAVTGVTNTVNSLSDSAVKYDADSNKTKVTLAGKGGTTITNIKEGALSDSSMDAVIGKQLYAEQTARESADTTLTNKIGSLSANGNYIQMNASVSSNFSTLDTQMKTNADAISKERTDRTDAISALKTELTSDSTNSSLASKANVNASNIGTKIDTSSETTEEAKKKKQEDNAKLWGEALGIGTIADGNEELLTGGTLYTELRPSADGFYIYNGKSTAYNLLALDSAINALGVEKVTDNSGNIAYVSNLYKYFKANPETTTNDDGTVTYATDADAQGTNSVAIGPNAKTARYTTTITSGDTTTTTETAADHAVAIGDGATVNAAGDQGVALGNGAVTGEAETPTSDGTTTTTTDAKGGESSVAIGDTAKANGNQALAFGNGASVLNPSGTAVSTGSTAIGSGAKVDGGDNSIAFGTKATVNKIASASIAIGKGAVTGGVDKPIVLTNGTTGTLAAAGGVDSIAIGNGAVSEGNEALALGNGAKVTNGATSGDSAAAIVKTGSAAIGDGANVYNSATSMAIGNGASISEGENTTVIGSGANATQTKQAFVAGYQASSDSSAESSVAIGDNASTHSARTTAIGYNAEAHYANSIAIGSEATTSDSGGGIAIGSNTSVAQGGIAIGKAANAQDISTLAIGDGAVANVNYSISIGYQAGLNTSEDYKERNGSLVAIGTSAGNNVKGMQNVAIGASAGSSVLSSNNISIGTNAGNGIKNVTSETDTNPQNGYNISIGAGANYTAGNTNQNIVSSIAIGHNTHAVNRAVALGEGASAQGDSGMALGNSATSSGSGSIAIGNTASASNGNIALGAGAIATGTPTGTGKWTNTVAPSYYISVGGKGNASDSTITLRRISNVADGSADQDVVTVKQLQKVSDDLENTIKGIDTSQLKTYSTTEIDNKIAEVNQNIKNSGVKYFSINSASQSTNSNNTGANGDGDADAMAIGPNAKASSVKALAIGNNVSASGTLSIAIGTASNPSTDTTTAETPHPTSSEGTSSVAIGTSAIAQTNDSIAIGTRAATYTANTTSTPVSTVGVQSIAIGFSAETRDDNAISIGTKSKANSVDSIAIGDGAEALNTSAVVIGKASTSEGSDSVTIGESNINNGKAVITTGNSNQITNKQRAKDAVQNSGVYGSSNVIKSVSSSNDSHAVTDVYAVGNNNTLNQNGVKNVLTDVSIMGNHNTIENGTAGAYTQTVKQIAVVGSGNTVKGNTDINTTTWGTVQRDTILGYGNTIDATKQSTPVSNLQILGNDVTATLGNSVYLGNNAAYVQPTAPAQDAINAAKTKADTAAEASDDYKAAATDEDKATIKAQYEAKYLYKLRVQAMEAKGTTAGMNSYNTDETYDDGTSYTYAGSNPTGVVTVGTAGSERRIQNVAAGLVSATSTDAVNGSQLYALTRQIRFGGDNSTFGDAATSDVNVVAKGSNEKLAITGGAEGVSVTTTTDGKSVTTVDGTKITDKNIAVIAENDALHVKLASNLQNLNTASMGKTTTGTAADGSTTTSYQETLKLDGTGDNGGTLALKDAKGENGVTLRTSGSTMTADVNGTATTRLRVNDKTVATTDDGLKFGGDTAGADSALKLNNKLTIKGGADTSKLTENNIGVVSDGSGTLTVKLNKNVNLGMDGSLTTGAVTATTVTTGNSTLDNTGLTITGGPKFTSTGISANSQQIKNVKTGTDDTDAANYSQIKRATTTLTTGKNGNVNVTTNTTPTDDGHMNYTIAVDNLKVKAATGDISVALANGITFKNGTNTTSSVDTNGNVTIDTKNLTLKANGTNTATVAMDNGINFKNGTNTTATVGADGTVTINATHNKLDSASYTASKPSDSSNQTTVKLKDTDGNETTLNLTDTYTTVSKNTDHTISFKRNDGSTPVSISLDDLNGASKEALTTAAAKATTQVIAGANVSSVDDTNVGNPDSPHVYKVNVSNLGVKVADGQKKSVALSDGLVFGNGTNTTASVGDNGAITFNVSDAAIKTKAKDAIDVVKGNDNVTVDTTTSTDGTKKTFTISAKDTYTTVTKNADKKTVTFARNDGESQTVSLNDLGGITAAQDKYVTSGTVTYDANGNGTASLTGNNGFTASITGLKDTKVSSGVATYVGTQGNASGSATLTMNDGSTATISGLKDDYITSATVGTENNHVTMTRLGGGTVDLNLNPILEKYSLSDYHLVGAGTTHDQAYAVDSNGTVTLNVVDDKNPTGTPKTIQITGLASQTGVNAGRTTVKSSDSSVIVNDGTSNSDTHTYDIKVDYSKIPANLTVQYSGDNGTAGSNTMDKATAFSGTANQIVTKAENGKVTFKLADNISGIQSVTTGNAKLDTNGLTITDGPSVLKTGINGGGKTISNVDDAAQDTDAATLKQVKNARTVVAKGNNVKDVTPVESTDGTHQVTYTVNVDNLSVKANKEAAKSVTLKNGLTFNNGTNTTASVGDNGEVKYDLNPTLTGLTSVTAGNSTLDTNGLTISGGPKFTKNGIDAGSQKITGVADGENANDAINKSQLDALQNQVSGGWNLVGKNSDGTAVTAKIGAGKKVTYVDGNYTKSVVTKDDSTGNATDATVKVDVTTGTFGSDAGKATSAADGLATTKDVAEAINSASWTIQDGNNTGNAQQVKAGDKVSLKAGDNLSLDQNGKEFTYKLNKTLDGMTSVTTVDDKQNTSVLNGEGLKVFDKEGNSLTQHATEIRIHDSSAKEDDTDVVLKKDGLHNGGHTITGVADGTIGVNSQDAINGSQFYKLQQTVTNGGWNITGEDTSKSTHIGNDKTVSFKNGTNTTVAVEGSDTGAVVKVNVNTTAISTDVDHKAAASGNGLATASDVASAINNAAWNVKKNGETAQQVKAGDTVTFDAGDNIVLNQRGTNFTYGLASDVNINSIRLGGTKDGKGNWAGGIYIGEQAGAGANLAKGFYITGLSNTKWDRATISENSSMAATEGQLKQAIENITKSGDGTGGFGLTADSGEAIMQDLRKTIQIKGDGEGKADGNITTSNESGVLRIRLNKKLDLTDQGSVTIGSSKVSDGSIVLGNTDATKKIALNSNEGKASIGGVTVNGTAKTVSGLSNTEWNVETAAANGYKDSNKAATESQLQTVYNQATKTASENELHTLAKEGGYTVDDNHQVSMDVVNGKGEKQGSIVINDVAKASEVGTVRDIAKDLQNKTGDTTKPTSVVDAINNLNDKVGDKNYLKVEGKEIANGDSATTAIGKLNNRMNDIYQTAGQHTTVSNTDKNLDIKPTTDDKGKTNYEINLSKQVNLGDVKLDGEKGSIEAKSVKADSFTSGSTVVNNDGVQVGKGTALTSDSLKVGGNTYVDNKGLNANDNAIRNVGDGKENGDAVNMKQLNEVKSDYQAADAKLADAIQQTDAGLNEVGRAVNKLGNRLNRVGAGAAALAALHPGAYDPNDKWDFSAGIGHYHDANAVAIGAYYHPNDTTILSIGGSMGGGENMVNAGITWKMGRSGREQAAQPVVVRKAEAAPVVQQAAPVRTAPVVTPAPVTTPASVKSAASATPVHAVPAVTTPMTQVTTGDTAALAQILARQTAILEKLAQNQSQAVPSAAVAHGDDIFPDVPDNHWAYAYVAKLEKAGALKGFKRPAVLKSPMMTRDDFASVLYTAMANGATTNPALNGDDSLNRLAQEFKAELKNVKV